jgi:hypothetical protein
MWSAGVEPAIPAFQAGALPDWSYNHRCAVNVRRRYRVIRSEVIMARRSRAGLRSVVLCLARPEPNDVFHATRLPFDPGSTTRWSRASSYVEELWSPISSACRLEKRTLKPMLIPLDFSAHSCRDLSLSGGASISIQNCFKLSITFRLTHPLAASPNKRATHFGSPSSGLLLRLWSSAGSSQRGLRRNRAGKSHRCDAGTANPSRRWPLRQMIGCWL